MILDCFSWKTAERDVIGTSEYTSQCWYSFSKNNDTIDSHRLLFAQSFDVCNSVRDNKYTANSSIWSSLLCHPALDSVHSFFSLFSSLWTVYNLMGLRQKRLNDRQLCVHKVSDVITKRKEEGERANSYRSARPAFSLILSEYGYLAVERINTICRRPFIDSVQVQFCWLFD